MFTLYIVPLHPVSFPTPVFRLTNRTAEEVSSFVGHLADCLCCVTFAGVEPDFTEFVPDGVYEVVPLEGYHAPR